MSVSAARAAAWLHARPLLVDVALALLAFGVGVGLMASGGLGTPDPDNRPLDALGVLLAALASLPLVARRRAPYAVLVVTAAATLATYAFPYGADVQVGTMFALYGIGASADDARAVRRGQLAVLAVLLLGMVCATAALDEIAVPELTALVVLWGGAWLLGDRVRLRRRQIADLRERARQAERAAERERRLAAAEERTRIARELHDSAGHAINVILVQAGAARLLRERDPEGAAEALETIEQVARTTIGEIDRMVQVLREGEAEPPTLAGSGVAALERLAAHHRDGGLPVALEAAGAPRALPAEVDRALYRIVQEALTNAARHGAGPAQVALAFERETLHVTVENAVAANGVADAARAGGGHGLVGMRERAALLGGELDVERAGGTFRVRARLPL